MLDKADLLRLVCALVYHELPKLVLSFSLYKLYSNVFPVFSLLVCMMKCARSAFHHAFFVGCGSESAP